MELSPRELRLGGEEGAHNALGFVDLAAGLTHSAAVTADGKVRDWWKQKEKGAELESGHACTSALVKGRYRSLPHPSKPHKRASQHMSTHAAGSLAQLYTWGDGAHHKLGHGDVKPVMRPKLVEALKDVRIVKAACGCVHGRGMWTVMVVLSLCVCV